MYNEMQYSRFCLSGTRRILIHFKTNILRQGVVTNRKTLVRDPYHFIISSVRVQ